MIQKILYTGNGASLSPIYEDGRVETDYVRLIADADMGITNGVVITTCVDILKTNIDQWIDCELLEGDI